MALLFLTYLRKAKKGIPFLLILFLLFTVANINSGQAAPSDQKIIHIQRFLHAQDALLEAKDLLLKGFLKRHYDKAEALLKECLEAFPEFADAHYYLGRIFYRRTDYSRALISIEKAKANFKPMIRLLEEIKRKAIKSNQTDELIHPEYKSYGNQNLGIYYDFHGDIFWKQRKYQAARAQYIAAIGLNPSLHNAYNKLAKLYYKEQNYRKAFYYSNLAEMNGIKVDAKLKAKIVNAFGKLESGKKKRKKIGLYLKIRGGAGFLDGGDYNNFIESSRDYYGNLIEQYNWTDVSMTESPFFKEIGAEIGYSFNRFAVALELGYMSKNYRVENVIYQYHYHQEGRWDNTFVARPVLLNIYFKLLDYSFKKDSFHHPFSIKAYLTGGGGIYLGKHKEAYNQEETDRFSYVADFSQESTEKSFGFHIGATVDFNISPHWTVFVESRYRFVSFKNMSGNGIYGSSTSPMEYEGDLLYVTDEYYNRSWFNLGPTGNIRHSERKAELNLNGMTLHFGIKFNF